MKDDLISREAAIDAVKHAWAKGLEPSQYIEIIPFVPAVPLDKLCEWLAGYAEPPLDALTMCDNPFEAWKMTLAEWMEEQDESD